MTKVWHAARWRGVCLFTVALVTSLGLVPTGAGAAPGRALSTVTLALDWTPNTNHTGFYVADTLGYYREAGIRLRIIPYTTTLPDELVSAGKADFGISFESEVAIDETEGLPVTSVMAILQHMASVVGFRPGSESASRETWWARPSPGTAVRTRSPRSST